MKRLLSIAALGLLSGGCAMSHPPAAPETVDAQRYAPSAASSLAFDAPVAAGYDLPGLDRESRQPGAFIGYQESQSETYSIGMYDLQTNDPYDDYYGRWSYTEKVGTRSR